MTLQQLRYLIETVRCGCNVSAAALELGTSQPAASKQLRLLEDELGLRLFIRNGKQFVDITEAGRRIVDLGVKMLAHAENIQRVAEEYADDAKGTIRIATTHAQARYVLPSVIKTFVARYPKVALHLKQGTPKQIALFVAERDVDFTISSEISGLSDRLLLLPCYRWNRSVLVPKDHPLKRVQPLTLEAIADYPLITYIAGFTGRKHIDDAFSRQGLTPNIVFTAADADVIKTYVKIGVGIGIVASMAFDPVLDVDLAALDVSHLIDPSIAFVGIQRDAYLRGYMFDFIELLAPHLTRQVVDQVLGNELTDSALANLRSFELPWH